MVDMGSYLAAVRLPADAATLSQKKRLRGTMTSRLAKSPPPRRISRGFLGSTPPRIDHSTRRVLDALRSAHADESSGCGVGARAATIAIRRCVHVWGFRAHGAVQHGRWQGAGARGRDGAAGQGAGRGRQDQAARATQGLVQDLDLQHHVVAAESAGAAVLWAKPTAASASASASAFGGQAVIPTVL